MSDEAKIAVELDTGPAKQKLRQLGREGEATARRVNQRGKSAGKSGGQTASGGIAQGFGAGVGFGLGKKVAGAVGVFGAIGAVAEEALSGHVAGVGIAIGSDVAAAKRAAREETKAAFSFQVGKGADISDAKQFYNSVLEAKHLPQQQGAAKLDAALGSGRGQAPDGKGPLDRLLEGITSELSTGFAGLREFLGG